MPLRQAANMLLILSERAAFLLRGEGEIGLNDRQGAIVVGQDYASHALIPGRSGARFRVILEARAFLRRKLLPDGPVLSHNTGNRSSRLLALVVSPDALPVRQPPEMIGLPINQDIARISLGVLVDLRMAGRTQQDQVVEGIGIEVVRRSVFMARARIAVRNNMRHFGDVLIAPHLRWKQGFHAVGFLAEARRVRK